MTDPVVENVDILIVGAGPVGMTLHLALAAGGQKSLLVDRRPQQAPQGDPRAAPCGGRCASAGTAEPGELLRSGLQQLRLDLFLWRSDVLARCRPESLAACQTGHGLTLRARRAPRMREW